MAEITQILPISNNRGSIYILGNLGVIIGPKATYYDAVTNNFKHGSFTSTIGEYWQYMVFEESRVTATYQRGKISYTADEIIVNTKTGDVRNYHSFKTSPPIIVDDDYITEPLLIYSPRSVSFVCEGLTLIELGPDEFYLAKGNYVRSASIITALKNETHRCMIGKSIKSGTVSLYCRYEIIELKRAVIVDLKCDLPGHDTCKLLCFDDESASANSHYVKICGDSVGLVDYMPPGKFTKAALRD
jgi:hypothetical protein